MTNRLLRNPSDFADVLRPLYGEQIAHNFEESLREHLLIAAALVNAAKAGDTRTASVQRTKWYENADSIANYLASINPYWNRNTWQALLYNHLKMTEDEATQILQGRCPESIATYDSIEMADEMARGIIKQFGI